MTPPHDPPRRLVISFDARVRGPLGLIRWRALPTARGVVLTSLTYGLPPPSMSWVRKPRTWIEVWNPGWAPCWVHACVLVDA